MNILLCKNFVWGFDISNKLFAEGINILFSGRTIKSDFSLNLLFYTSWP
jgi:hypothetical protein